MKATIQSVHGFVHDEIPKEGETIADHLHLDALLPNVRCVSYYLRSPQECPFGRGNWLVDIEMCNGQLFCLKYPKEIEQEHFVGYLEPFLSKLVRAMDS
jgi:hypothetical protein